MMEKNKLMMIIIIALLVLLLGTVGAVSFYVLNLVRSQPDPDAPSQIARGVTLDEIESISLGEFVTNLAKTEQNKDRLIRISLSLAYDKTDKKASEALVEKINQHHHIARSIALACILSSTYDELIIPDGLANLADKIRVRLQEEFESNLIVDVYIDDWLLV
jgi:flagellar basal body-associated protein FliL